MNSYLITGRYKAQGFEGLVNNSASSLAGRLSQSLTSHGGRLASLSFFGAAYDVFVIVELPRDIAATALGALMASMMRSGAFDSGIEASRLLPAEEADLAVKEANNLR
jgi:uncharacterized protein with GYD domain